MNAERMTHCLMTHCLTARHELGHGRLHGVHNADSSVKLWFFGIN